MANQRRPAHPKEEIEGVARILALEPRSRVLDLGCGAGRMTLELARRGHRVLGIDPDERALVHARAGAKGETLNVHFMKADPRAISYRAEFDAVVFLDGAFGRLPSDRDGLRALECARRALKPGAALLIDVPNREWLVRRLEPGHGVFDLGTGRLAERRSPSAPSARLYALTELLVLLERAELSFSRCWGGFDGSVYGLDSPRLVVLAQRPSVDRSARKAPAADDDRLPKTIHIKGRR